MQSINSHCGINVPGQCQRNAREGGVGATLGSQLKCNEGILPRK